MMKDFLFQLSSHFFIGVRTTSYDSTWQYFISVLNDIYKVINGIWNYKLFSTEGQSVSISNLFIAIVFLIVGLKIARYLSNLIHNKLLKVISLDITVTDLLGKIVHYIFIIIVTVIVLDIAHVPLTIFTFIGGALAISIGVGGQHVVNNFISGIVLLIETPIKVGDFVEIEEITGRVVSIDARSVNIRTQENKNVFIPHSVILQNQVINWTAYDSKIRATTKISFNQGVMPVNELKEIIINSVLQNKDILPSPKPQVLLTHFEHDIMYFEINFWINLALVNRIDVISDINSNLSQALDNHNLKLSVESRKNLK